MKASSSFEYAIGEPIPGTKWVVRSELGQGGMGLVLAVEKGGVLEGAMKVLRPPFASKPEFAEKFLGEVKLTARLQHPNIVQVLDFDRLPDGTPFMVMERLYGRTLRAALRETRQHGKLWTASNAYAVAVQACGGLDRAHAHEPPIVHRDIKPENLFLHRRESSYDSVVKVMDFGLAAVVGEPGRQNVGTPRYMAPEQVSGGDVSAQTDQYALALVVYEMLTGRLPWDVDLSDRRAVIEAHLRAPPLPPSQFCPWLPPRMDRALLKALSKDPRARHPTLDGLLFELRGLQWIGDCSAMAVDGNTTDPVVGLLAEAGPAVREDPGRFERMTRNETPAASAAVRAGASERSADLSEPSDPPTWSWPERAASLKPSPRAAADLSAVTEAMTTVLREDPPEPGAQGSLRPLATPMTGVSTPGPIRRGLLKTKVGRAGGTLVAAGGVMLLALSARSARSPRAPVTSAASPMGSQPPASASDGSDLGLGAVPPRFLTEAVDRPTPPADPVVTVTLFPATEPSAPKTTSARPGAGPDNLSARKTTAPPRPALRIPPPKPSVPDDGRDELYLPPAAR